MSSILLSNNLLKEKSKTNSNLRKALYYAYHQKKNYGDGIEELPIYDNDRGILFSSYNESQNEVSLSSDSLYNNINTRIAEDIQAFIRENKRGVKNGTVLKLVAYEVEPMHRMYSPIKNVRIGTFNFPVNCKIFQDRIDKGQEHFNWQTDISEYKRVIATTYQKEEKCFGVETQEKNIYTEPVFDLESNVTKYYFKWIYSQGNIDGLKFINAIKSMTKNSRKIIIPPEKDPLIANEISLQEKFHYLKQLDSTTLEWIKTQPYFTKVQKVNDNSGASTHEQFSINFLKLIGQDTNNKDQVHSSLRKSKVMESCSTNDFFGVFQMMYEMSNNPSRGENYEQYIKCGLEMPYLIFPSKSMLLKNIENGEVLYKGHFVIWNESWIEPEGNFRKCIGVFVIDEKCKQDF